MTVSVILPVHDRKELLDTCLASLQCQTIKDFEIIIIDDASTDGTRAMLEALPPSEQIRIIYLDQNKGASYARNRGIAISKGDVLALIDSDCTATPTWLKEITSLFKDDPTLMITAGKTIAEPASSYWEQVNTSENFIAHKSCFIKAAPTCNMAIRRSFALRHPFDETLKLGEDLDLCLTCINAGSRILYTDRAIVIHQQRTTFRSTIRRQFNYGYHNARVRFKHRALPGISYGAWLILFITAVAITTVFAEQPLWHWIIFLGGIAYLTGVLFLHIRPKQQSPAGLLLSYPGFLFKCLADSIGNISYLCMTPLRNLRSFMTH